MGFGDFIEKKKEQTANFVDKKKEQGEEFVDDTTETAGNVLSQTQETVDNQADNVASTVPVTADDIAGLTQSTAETTFQTGKQAGKTLDNVTETVTGTAAEPVQELSQRGMVGAFRAGQLLSGEDPDATREEVAEEFSDSYTGFRESLDEKTDDTALDNPTTDATVWAADAFVAEPAEIAFGTTTGVDPEEGGTDYAPGTLETAELALTGLGISQGGKLAKAGGRFGDELAGLSRGSDEAAQSTDDVAQTLTGSSGADEAAETVQAERVSEAENPFSEVDDSAGGFAGVLDDADEATALPSGSDEVAELATWGGDEATELATRSGDEAAEFATRQSDETGALREAIPVSSRTADDATDAGRAAEDATDASRAADDSGGLFGASDDTARAADDTTDAARAGEDATDAARAGEDGSDAAQAATEAGEEAAEESGSVLGRLRDSMPGRGSLPNRRQTGAAVGTFLVGGAVGSGLLGGGSPDGVNPENAPEQFEATIDGRSYSFRLEEPLPPSEEFPNGAAAYSILEEFENKGYWVLVGVQGNKVFLLDESGETRTAGVSARKFAQLEQAPNPGQNGGNNQ